MEQRQMSEQREVSGDDLVAFGAELAKKPVGKPKSSASQPSTSLGTQPLCSCPNAGSACVHETIIQQNHTHYNIQVGNNNYMHINLPQEVESLYQTSYGEKTDDVLPEEILNMDENALDIFKRALTHGKETDRSIRLMIVGHAGVGKTTLTEHILGHSKNTMIPVESTNGIDVHIKRCKIQFDTGAWLPINEVSQDVAMYQRLANSIRALGGKEQSKAFENQRTEDSDRTASGSKRLINHDEQDLRSSASSKSFSKKEFLEVIEEVQKRCTCVEKNACDVSIWDFAGQYVFYCTHQVFLSRRAIYLLVTDLTKHLDGDVQDTCYIDSDGLNTRKLSEYVTFWMNSIHTYCGAGKDGSPRVILIGTFADKLPKEERKELASIFFDNLRMILVDTETYIHLVDKDFDIDNKSQDPTVDSLKNKILEVAKEQSWWHEEIPTKWVSLERILLKCKHGGEKVLHKQALMTLNNELTVPIETDEELEVFLRFHHDAGNILYFSDAHMRDYIVLDPQWLVDALKSLITAEQFCKMDQQRLKMWRAFDRTAILNMEFIDNLWKMDGVYKVFATHKSILLQYMEKLKIIAKPLKKILSNSKKNEIDYLVPCMLKERPPPDLVCYHDTKCHRKSTSILCFVSETNLIPPYIFNMLLAACIVRWNIATSNRILVLYCGYAEFEVNEVHILHLHFSNNIIQIWLERYSPNDPEDPDKQICAEVKHFIESSLEQEVKHRYPITIYFKCPRDTNHDIQYMIRFDDLLVENQRCKVHDTCPVFTSRDLRYWIPNADISDSIVDSDNPVGYPLRKKVDDTMSERVVHMLHEGMKSVGLLIDNGRPCGTVFRVGSKFLMTALHCLNSIKDLDDNEVCVDFNMALLLPQRKVYHLTSRKVYNDTLDFVILEISDPDEQLPGALELDKDITDIYSKMNSVDLIGYGHPDNLEKTLDRDCKLISTKHLQSLETEAEQWLKENKSGYRTALMLKGEDPDMVNIGYRGINTPGKFHFHCYMQHGASGAPAITTIGSKAKVVGMLTHGLPKFYFYLPKALQNGFKTNFLFEMASIMSSIYQCVIACDPTLAVDLFK